MCNLNCEFCKRIPAGKIVWVNVREGWAILTDALSDGVGQIEGLILWCKLQINDNIGKLYAIVGRVWAGDCKAEGTADSQVAGRAWHAEGYCELYGH